ncbi:putative polypeptide N-acetylgalactosaminyltransferase 10 [Lingula anatina]|uniref:Polypeptide N-acetylgalactosaminyltransferase n=1 Tax=Lingula anatina TaxID=7574 RepID=A0A1S3JMP6_LINAN|nr:putative polypeptide N-acetylgalactosaminyltransferase 10 [Lingula anatina]|eukprot:XP_013411643.1 putative polypeptide N-acetylgalactosaminyltransferase 10 [Lingula anatina]
MRRNTKTLLKYVIVAGVCLAFGPLLLRTLFGDKPKTEALLDRGLPLPPGDNRHEKFLERPKEEQPLDNEPVDPNAKIDWHNYKQIAEEKERKGPGEQGSAVILSPEEEQKKNDLYKVNGFNAYASDKISLDRALVDIRHPDCKHKKYLAKLPTASVVIPFHNEHWTTLLRNVHSLINRSPKSLLHEVILADDASTKDFLGQKLDDYLKEHFTNVRTVRAKKREGLIRTRLLGAKAATGDVLIFLDSHCEANVNWLPPLLEPIAQNRRTAVCPFIDVIDFENFAYRAQDEGARGAFDWEFFYKRLPLLPEDLRHPSEPFKSPVMAGGLFAIDRKWFWELGGYDPGLDIWGGEQYELSFKIWQCHGQMVDAPCSRVGHIYRKFAPFPNPGIGDFVGKNYRRVAVVWMDEYAEHLYRRRPHYKNIDPGDLTEQKAIRQKLKCKPFKYFMEEVAFDLKKYYPPVEPPPFAEGEVRNLGSGLCIDTRFRGQNEKFGLETCISESPKGGGEQQLELSWHKDIRPKKRNVCFDVSSSVHKAPVILFGCHGMQGNQLFKYNSKTKQIFHPISNHCLDSDSGNKEIFMTQCDENLQSQKWTFEKLNAVEMKKLWNEPVH